MAVSILQFGVVFTVGLFCLGPAAGEVVSFGTGVRQIPLSLNVKDPESIIAKKDSFVWFDCEATSIVSHGPLHYTWYHDDNVFLSTSSIATNNDPYNRTVLSNGTLLVPRVVSGATKKRTGSRHNKGVEGEYKCLVRNDRGALLSNPATLTIASLAHTFQNHPFNIEIEETQSTVLPCQINSVPAALIRWERNNKSLPHNERYVPLPSGALLINSVSSIDAGYYKCIATNRILKKSRISAEGQLTVLSPPNSPQAPKLLLLVSQQPLNVILIGNDLSLHCAATGWPVPQIKWFYNMEYNLGNNISTLTLKNVSSVVTGNYTCVAFNKYGTVSQNFSVEVRSPPYFNVTPVSSIYPSAKTLRLECNALGFPTSEVHWLVNGSSISYGRIRKQNGTLIFRHSFTTDKGIYQCVAENSAGRRWAAAEIFPDPTREFLYPPVDLRCRPYDETSVCLVWDKSPNITVTAYSISKYLGNELYSDDVAMTNNKLSTNLSMSINYTFYVRLYTKTSASDPSRNVTCSPGKIGKRMLKVTTLSESCVELTWNEVNNDLECDQNVTYYKVFWKQLGQIFSYGYYVTGTKFIISGLMAGKTYKFQVPSKDNYDLTASFNYTLSPPGIKDSNNEKCNANLLNLMGVNNVGSNSVNIDWFGDEEEVDFFSICYQKNRKDVVLKNDNQICTQSNVSSLNVTGLKPGTFYSFSLQVIYKNGSEVSYPYFTEVQTATDVPYVVQNLNYKIVSPNSVCVTFKPPLKEVKKVVGYMISYSPNAQWHWTRVNITLSASESNQECSEEDNETLSVFLTSLNPSFDYTLIVQPFSASSIGYPSESLVFSTKESISTNTSNESHNSKKFTLHDKQKLGIALGVSISLFCIVCCSSYILFRRRCEKRQASRRAQRTRVNYLPVGLTALPNLHPRGGEMCSAESHEMEVLMSDDSIRSLPPTSVVHIDTKGGVGFPNYEANGIIKNTKVNGLVNITENPQFKHLTSNGHAVAGNSDTQNGSLKPKKSAIVKNGQDCKLNNSKKVSDYNSNNESKCHSDGVDDETSFNATTTTFINDSIVSIPVLVPNG